GGRSDVDRWGQPGRLATGMSVSDRYVQPEYLAGLRESYSDPLAERLDRAARMALWSNVLLPAPSLTLRGPTSSRTPTAGCSTWARPSPCASAFPTTSRTLRRCRRAPRRW